MQTRCGMGVSGGSELVALGSSGKVAAVQSLFVLKPELLYNDENGYARPAPTSGVLEGAQVLALYFGGSWCPHCVTFLRDHFDKAITPVVCTSSSISDDAAVKVVESGKISRMVVPGGGSPIRGAMFRSASWTARNASSRRTASASERS